MRNISLVSLLLALTGACAFDWDGLDPRVSSSTGGATGVGGAGGTGGNGAVGGSGGVGGTAGAGGTQGGAGGTMPALVDRGLLTRYYLDEAASGRGPTEVNDAAPDPLTLSLDYGELGTGGTGGAGGAMGGAGPTGPNVSWVEIDGNRGLHWSTAEGPGGAFAQIGGTKILGLDGLSEATAECVVAVDGGSVVDAICDRIAHVGVNNNGAFTLCSVDGDRVDLRINGMTGHRWNVGLSSLGRIVLHLVLDTTQALEDDRARLYIDGVVATPSSVAVPQAPIALTSGEYVLGNRNAGDGSTQGTLFYCAHYTVALTEAEIANNVSVLMVDDDSP